jgi:hypothetical protein
MTDEKQKELDRELDTALAKYAAVEPRVGLEERVLASLRAGQAQVPERVWWRWSVAGALAAIIVVALALAWRSSRPHAPVIANHHPAPAASVEPSGTRASSSGSAIPRTPVRRSPRKAEMAANPRLDQFPSPRALSEQEKLLVRYVHEFPEEAVLIAQAQAESEKEIEQLIGNQSAGMNQDQQ